MLDIRALKKKKPNNKVKTGVNEFKIPTKELSNEVCAFVNKKAGIPLPITPDTNKGKIYFFFSFLNAGYINGVNDKNAINSLRAATCISEYSSKPLFIKINELPQIRAKENKIK